MGNVIAYVKEYGAYSFAERPLCQVDILVLAQLSYFKLDGIVPAIGERKNSVSLQEIAERMDPAQVFSYKYYEKANTMLWEALLASRRFGTMRCNFYRSRLEEENQTQFAAITFFPEACMPVVAFRGTDENLVGWKEDFYMAFKEPIPAQKMSALYLNQIASNVSGPFVICGHSKGGNLAVYAAALAEKSVQERIEKVYSFDGPGFRPEFLQGSGYGRVREKMHRVLPSSSLVGMLLQHAEGYSVVKSHALGMLQHDCFTWQIKDGDFLREKDIEKNQKRVNEILNQWIFSLEEEEIRVFVETLFGVVDQTGARTVSEFAADWRQNLKICFRAIRKLDAGTRRRIRQIFKLLTALYGDQAAAQKETEGQET